MENWARAISDLQSTLAGVGSAADLLQARVVSKNGTGSGGPYPLMNVTGNSSVGTVSLPYDYTNTTPVYLGDDGLGYPPNLYPNLTFTSTVVNSTFNQSIAYFDGNELSPASALFIGPWLTNASFALLSITMPIINNTSATDTLGWITVVISGELLFAVNDNTEGLGNTGEVLIIGTTTVNNTFPPGVMYNSMDKDNKSVEEQLQVQFVLPPTQNSTRSTRHASHAYPNSSTPFAMQDYPAVLKAFTQNNGASNNGGSLISTNDEENQQVSVGFALPSSNLVNWVLIIEYSHGEIIQPINHLRDLLLACVFGTTGVILLLLFPIAHFSVRPIRRLRDATKKTVEPYRYPFDDGSVRSSVSNDREGLGSGDDDIRAIEAKKEGFVGRMSRFGRGDSKTKRERQDQMRRQSFRIPGKVQDRKHFINDELTDLTATFNEMSEELMMQYERLEERVKERTQELEISKKAAEAANESKTLFIANISHELKTPLNGILGMCAVCMSEDDQSKIKRSLGIIYKSGDLLLHLLTDLLTFSKNQIGRQLSLEEKEFRLADISSQILSIFDKQSKDGSIILRVGFQGPLDCLETNTSAPVQSGLGPWGTGRVRDMYVWGDQHRILQVIINLVSNSLKFTPPGGSVEVRIRCVGEVEERVISRKTSIQSKQSKQSKQLSSRNTKKRGRVASGSESSVVMPGSGDGEMSTALQINGREPKSIPYIAVREHSSSPPPINARTFIFEFEIEDTGPGIPESQQQRVFEPFVQGDLGLSKKYGGTGLGLSICAQLASLMKGTIVLKSQEGVGSKFTMRIPLFFTKERADSTTSSSVNPNSRRNSLAVPSINDEPSTPQKSESSEDLSDNSVPDMNPALSGFDTPAKPRLVGLSQPFFATSPPLESSSQQIAAIERVAAQASKRGDKVRVLVAEDNQVNQEVVLRMLKLEDIYGTSICTYSGMVLMVSRCYSRKGWPRGVRAREREHGAAKAVQPHFHGHSSIVPCLQEFHTLLVLIKSQMPNVDGLQSTRLIREMGYSAPIVALTAFAEESNVKECMDSGMDFFLPKPIRRPALKQVLKRYCATIPEAAEENDGSPPPEASVDKSSDPEDTIIPVS